MTWFISSHLQHSMRERLCTYRYSSTEIVLGQVSPACFAIIICISNYISIQAFCCSPTFLVVSGYKFPNLTLCHIIVLGVGRISYQKHDDS